MKRTEVPHCSVEDILENRHVKIKSQSHTISMLLQARTHGLRKILAMLKSSGLILQPLEGVGLPIEGWFLSVLKISLLLWRYG